MSFLETMVAMRRKRILAEFGGLDDADRERFAACSSQPRDFAAALRDRQDVAVIAEVKKASPSAGPIAPDCDASTQALHYQSGGAAAISVLTEPDRFGGSFADLSDVADAADVPVLCKDFIVDPVQLFLARGHGADAVLLIVRVLGDLIPNYAELAFALGLTPVVEVADASELPRAWGSGAPIILVNSRDLRTLKVDPDAQAEVIGSAARSDALVVAASGIKVRSDVQRVAVAGVQGVLVGESLMRAAFPEDVLGELTGVPRARPSG